MWTVNCNDMTNDELAKIDKGQKVTVVGEFDDGGDRRRTRDVQADLRE